jgi:hypothetical protein
MGSDWTDHAGDFVGFRAVDYRELDGFLRVCEEFSGSTSGGSRTDIPTRRVSPAGSAVDRTVELARLLVVGSHEGQDHR